jgi:ketosteroid isomerase-like protein
MTRFSICILVFIPLCSTAFAQAPVSNAVSSPASTSVSGPVSVQSTATSAASPEIREFQKIEDSWSVAVNDRDQYGLELVLSPLFVDVSATGDITTRNQQVASVITGEDKTIHLDQRVITVRMLGDVAVTNGTYALHHKANAAEVTEKGIFTHVYERSHGSWLCINSQRTVLHEDSNAKQKKQSNAELPFHIPLFSKSDKGPQ